MHILTPRLRLRPLVDGDLEDLVALHADPEVMLGSSGVATPRTRAASEKWLRRTLSLSDDDAWETFRVEDRVTGAFLGRCGLRPVEGRGDTEVAYAFARHAWGRGVATEAADRHGRCRSVCGAARTDNRLVEWIRTHRRAAVLLCGLITVAGGLLIVSVLGQGSASWTGVEVKVPSCPTGAEGCRLLVTHTDGTAVVHADWSASATTVDIQLPAGDYDIAAEGCTGYRIEKGAVTVQSGAGTSVDMGSYWQTLGFTGRTCPGFVANAAG
jgi:hypothetical protein